MPVLLFKLNQVPLDEADEVRALLAEEGVPFYETTQGFWGFSLGGLWLADDQLHQQARAQALLDDYQRERLQQARQSYQAKSFLGAVVEKPLRLVLLLAVFVILYFSIVPFVKPLLG